MSQEQARSIAAEVEMAGEEVRSITDALKARDRQRRIQAIREMHPKDVAELLADICSAAGKSTFARLDRQSGVAGNGKPWFHIQVAEAIDEIEAMHTAELEAMCRSFEDERYDQNHACVRSQEWADECVERADNAWKWGD